MERRYVDTAEQAKLMRAVLRESFPGVKFSVRTDRYSMGSCVRVSWTDGPTEKAVSAVARQLDGTYFDSAIDYAGSVYHTLDGEPVSFSGSVSCSRHHSDEQTAAFRARWERLSVHRRARLLEEHGLSRHYRPEDNDAWCPIMCGWDMYGQPAQESATLARIACTGSDAYGCSETALAIDAAAKGTEPAPVPEPEQPPQGYKLDWSIQRQLTAEDDEPWLCTRPDGSTVGRFRSRDEAIAAAREDAARERETAAAPEPAPRLWTYGLSYRPAGFGTVPPGRVATAPERTARFPYGIVSYDRPLSSADVGIYRLQLVETPSGPVAELLPIFVVTRRGNLAGTTARAPLGATAADVMLAVCAEIGNPGRFTPETHHAAVQNGQWQIWPREQEPERPTATVIHLRPPVSEPLVGPESMSEENDDAAKLKLLAIDYHRNGIWGQGFWVLIFRDQDGSRKLATWFGTLDPECAEAQPALQSCYSVLDLDIAAAGSIAMHNGASSNAWRGDHYIDQIRRWVADYQALPDHETRAMWNTGGIGESTPAA